MKRSFLYASLTWFRIFGPISTSPAVHDTHDISLQVSMQLSE